MPTLRSRRAGQLRHILVFQAHHTDPFFQQVTFHETRRHRDCVFHPPGSKSARDGAAAAARDGLMRAAGVDSTLLPHENYFVQGARARQALPAPSHSQAMFQRGRCSRQTHRANHPQVFDSQVYLRATMR
jgi:hypothetical protein